jgi:hypothetical protein
MGVYWKAICDDRREIIDPGRIGKSGRKLHEIASGPAAAVIVTYMSAYEGWQSANVRLVSSDGLDAWAFEQATAEYKDVTDRAIAFYNERLEITPPLEVTR